MGTIIVKKFGSITITPDGTMNIDGFTIGGDMEGYQTHNEAILTAVIAELQSLLNEMRVK